jgi:hypothetical protein
MQLGWNASQMDPLETGWAPAIPTHYALAGGEHCSNLTNSLTGDLPWKVTAKTEVFSENISEMLQEWRNETSLVEITVDVLDFNSVLFQGIVFGRIEGATFWRVSSILVTFIVKAAATYLIRRSQDVVKEGRTHTRDFPFRKLCLFISTYIFVVVCLGHFIPSSVRELDLLQQKGCYVRGSGTTGARYPDYWSFRRFDKDRRLFEFFYCMDALISLCCAVVGARFIAHADSIQEMIMSSTAATFVFEFGEFFGSMANGTHLWQEYSPDLIHIALDKDSFVLATDRLSLARKGFGYFLILGTIPLVITGVLMLVEFAAVRKSATG